MTLFACTSAPEPTTNMRRQMTDGDTSDKLLLARPSAGRVARDSLQQSEVEAHLDTLTRWNGAQKNYYYIYSIPRDADIYRNVRSLSQRIRNSEGGLIWNPAGIHKHSTEQGIKLEVPQGMQDLDADGICARLDGFGELVPISAADAFATHWIHGFVTRLTLGVALQGAIDYNIGRFDFDPRLTRRMLDLTFPVSFQVEIPKAFTKAESYQGDEPFQTKLAKLMQPYNLQAAGILWGWQAATELEQNWRTSRESQYRDAALALLQNRYSPREQGEVCSFTLSYIAGFARARYVKRNNGAGDDYTNPSVLLSRLSEDEGLRNSKLLTGSLYSLYIDFFKSAAKQSADQPQLQSAVNDLANFLVGWQVGSSSAADVVFEQAYKLGYGDGFRDGYAKGQVDGFRDGFAEGFEEAWNEQQDIIDNLGRELDRMERELEEANRGSWFSHIGNALDAWIL